MNRRDLIALLGGAAIARPFAARAQQKAMPVIGFLSAVSSGEYAQFVAAFHQGLREAGYVEGQNLAIEYRWAEGSYERLPALAADLVSRNVDAIVTGGTPPTRAAKIATSTIPVVFVYNGDPALSGLVDSLAHPGGNLTGVSFLSVELMLQRLDLLSELIPRAASIALLVRSDNPRTQRLIEDMREAARAKGWRPHILKAGSESEIDTAFGTLAQRRAGGLVIDSDVFLSSRREQLVGLAARRAIPAIYPWREFAVSGGLISYGPNLAFPFRLAATYIGKILKGAKPADLPVQQPTKFELVINLKTAKALGLTVPQALLARADEVIE